jgi:hypothetical protein
VLVTYVSSALVLGLDALTYVVLAVLVAPGCRRRGRSPPSTRRPAAAGWRCCGPIPSCSGC